MQILRRSASQWCKCWVLTLFLAIAPAALASTTWYVDGVNGNDNNDCLSSKAACQTIGHAISLTSRFDSIMVAPAIYTENLTIDHALGIIGSGAPTTIVDGNQAGSVITISAAPKAQIHVRLSGLTIRNGRAYQYGGGVYADVGDYGSVTINNSIVSGNVADGTQPDGVSAGGGIFINHGTVTINNSTISDNLATSYHPPSGGGINGQGSINKSTISNNNLIWFENYCCSSGGGINGTFSINDSTISGNQSWDYGAGINGQGSINNSTIIGNIGDDWGWGSAVNGTFSINNSTISRNFGQSSCGVLNGTFSITNSTISGNGEYYPGAICGATLQNSIVANSFNYYGPIDNCYGTTSLGYNLSSDDTCNFNGPGDLNNTDPKLGGLGYNGGPTQTFPLLSGSPAIDGGNPNGCTDSNGNLLATDQRGYPRPGKWDTGACDMGAYELQTDIGPSPFAH